MDRALLDSLRAVLGRGDAITVSPPASEDRVIAIEQRLGVRLPASYRLFVREVADGVGAPGCPSLLSLDDMLTALGPSDPARPFLYDRAAADAVRAALASLPEGMTPLESEAFMRTQRPGIPDGCIPIADNGGNDITVLVTTGDERGWTWRSGELDAPEQIGLYAMTRDPTPLRFFAWLSWWAPTMLVAADAPLAVPPDLAD